MAEYGVKYAPYFDGVDDYGLIPHHPNLQLANNFRIEILVKIDQLNQVEKYIFSKYNHPAIIFGYVAKTIEFYASGFTGSDPRPGSQIMIADNDWHEIIYDYDGVTWRGLLDGVQVFSVTRTFVLGANTEGWCLADSASPYFSNNLAGNLARAKICKDGILQGSWEMGEGAGLTIHDSSGSDHHGTLYGATWERFSLPGEVIMSARLIGSSTITATAQRIRGLSADLRGQATLSATAQRIRGMSANLIGTATLSARMQLVATMRARLVGSATLRASMLVLHVPEGVYVIDADEIFTRDRPMDSDCYANHVEVLVKPLVPAEEPEEVYRSQEPIAIGAGEAKTVSVKYKSTPVIEASAQLENAPAGATIDTEKTAYYAWGADVVIESPAAGTFDLIVEGKPLKVEGEETVIAEDAESIEKWGIKKYTFDSPLVQDRATGEWIAAKLIEMFANPSAPIVIEWRGDPALTLADVALIPEYQRQGLDQRGIYYISKQEIEMAPGFRVKTEGRKV